MRGMQFAGGLSALLFGLLCAPGISQGASIKGKVVFAGPVPVQKKIDVTIDQYVCGTQKDAGDLLLSPQKELRNAVVWLENPPAGTVAPAESAKVEMDQNGCTFIPRVVVVPAGGTVVRINCDLHSWMAGWVVVAAHPYYAITGADGQFAFDNLPPGQYNLQVWHERLGTTRASVTIGDQQPGRVTVEMKSP
jgi:hypothetical protein